MSKWRLWVALCCALLMHQGATLSVMAQGTATFPVAGLWAGKISVAGVSLRVVFHIRYDASGALAATLDSPDQGAHGIPFDRASLDKNTIRLESKLIQGSFYGSLQKDGSLAGQWSQGGMTFPLVLARTGFAPEPARPQEPKPPYPYDEEAVSFQNEKAELTLSGTLTKPKGTGPFPAVLLIPGSGPTDRDESAFGHKPFLVLADYLTRRGVIVLRVDKRGVGQSKGNLALATLSDFTSDALSALAYLKARKDVATARIGVIGHSEGGLVGSQVVLASSDVAFLILLASPGLPGEQIILGQQARLLAALGLPESDIKKAQAFEAGILAVVKADTDQPSAENKLKRLLEQDPQTGSMGQIGEAQVKTLLSPWYRDFIRYDPRPTLALVKCPVLAIGGDKDLQVPAVDNLVAIKEALRTGGNTKYKLSLLPGINHLLQRAATGLPTEYATIEETIDPTVLQILDSWITAQLNLKQSTATSPSP